MPTSKWLSLSVLGFIVLCLALTGTVAAQAEESSTPSVPARIGTKLVRGLTNLLTGAGEIPKQVYLVGKREGWVQGTFRGPFEGLGMFIARTLAGAYEVVTFPVPVPPGYQPMLHPEYVWQPEPPPELTVPIEPVAPMLTPDNR